MILKPEEKGMLALFTFPYIKRKTFACWWQNTENFLLAMIYYQRNCSKLGCDHVFTYQLHHSKRKGEKHQRFTFSVFPPCLVFTRSIKNTFPNTCYFTHNAQLQNAACSGVRLSAIPSTPSLSHTNKNCLVLFLLCSCPAYQTKNHRRPWFWVWPESTNEHSLRTREAFTSCRLEQLQANRGQKDRMQLRVLPEGYSHRVHRRSSYYFGIKCKQRFANTSQTREEAKRPGKVLVRAVIHVSLKQTQWNQFYL